MNEWEVKHKALAALVKPEDVVEAEAFAEMCIKSYRANPHDISFTDWVYVLLNFVQRRQPEKDIRVVIDSLKSIATVVQPSKGSPSTGFRPPQHVLKHKRR